MTYKVMIVDDHELVADGIGKLVACMPDFELVGHYRQPVEALQKIRLLKPDVVITDLDMPAMNGLELIGELKDEKSLKFILLTMHLDRFTVSKALKLNVAGYLLKNADSSEFEHCLKTVTSDKSYYTPRAMKALVDKSSEIKTSVIKRTQILSQRELEILKLVSEGLSTKEISEQLHIAVRTTETHRKSIMNKLEVSNVAGMVRIAIQEGLLD